MLQNLRQVSPKAVACQLESYALFSPRTHGPFFRLLSGGLGGGPQAFRGDVSSAQKVFQKNLAYFQGIQLSDVLEGSGLLALNTELYKPRLRGCLEKLRRQKLGSNFTP